jgi:hypothetical protein
MRKRSVFFVVPALLLTTFGLGTQGATADPTVPVTQARLVKAPPGPTPRGEVANYVADVTTGDTGFVSFTSPGAGLE